MIRYYITIVLLFFSVSISAQVIIQFVPEVSGRSVDGLFQCKIINPNRTQNAVLTITVTERTRGTVCIVKTSSFTLIQGTNSIPVSTARGASIQFANNNLGQFTRINKQFSEGDYDYCFNVKLSLSDLPEEQCFSYLLAPFSDLSLIEPANHDKICDTKPLFSWQPLIPGIAESYYQLVLTEIKDGQNATEALNYNFPVINQSTIISPVLPYPSIARELTKGKQYAWQVTVYKDQTILNRSEVWRFTLDCQDSVKMAPDNGYREIEDLLGGSYYTAYGALKFALLNPYQAQVLKYQIYPVSGSEKKIRRLPQLILQAGTNKIVIDLVENGGFKQDGFYILKVWLLNGEQKSLRFLYKEPE